MTDSLPARYPRDLRGHGRNPPHAQWPCQARVAIQFVLNFEEGGENSVLHGDAGSEQFLSEMFNPASYPARHLSMEGIYEYGSRVGVWRILREFERRGLPLTIFGVSSALQRSPEVTAAFRELGHEIACHGLKWIHYQNIDEATARAHLAEAMAIIERLTGERAVGLPHLQPERQVVAVVVAVVLEAAVVSDSRRVFGLSRPVYQPSARSPVSRSMIAIASARWARSVASSTFW